MLQLQAHGFSRGYMTTYIYKLVCPDHGLGGRTVYTRRYRRQSTPVWMSK